MTAFSDICVIREIDVFSQGSSWVSQCCFGDLSTQSGLFLLLLNIFCLRQLTLKYWFASINAVNIFLLLAAKHLKTLWLFDVYLESLTENQRLSLSLIYPSLYLDVFIFLSAQLTIVGLEKKKLSTLVTSSCNYSSRSSIRSF